MTQDVYQRVTDQIVAQLEAGVRPWVRPWGKSLQGGGVLPIRANGEAYRGVNTLLLWGEQVVRGYTQRRWMTFKQALDLGAHVRKGEKSALVVYANRISRTEENAAGEEVERSIPFMKAYNVFNIEQIEGLPADYFETVAGPVQEPGAIPAADAFFRRVGADWRASGTKAAYMPELDFIVCPPLAAFTDAAAYYATLAHEHVHWTAHKSRLARDLSGRFGSQAYAAEELIAEIGAAFIAALLGFEATAREDHAAYLANWLQVLKSDKRAIFTAATQAQRAADYLAERGGLIDPPLSVDAPLSLAA